MLGDFIGNPGRTAADVRQHLAELEIERELAVRLGVADIDTYMADLKAEIEVAHHVYVASAVTEIATLRGELFGRRAG
jgi:hypothetical protein